MNNYATKLLVYPLLILLVTNSASVSAQNFYKDYTTYLEGRYKPGRLSKRKTHYIARHFGTELKIVFNQVKQNTGFSMLASDTVFIFDESNLGTGSYSNLIWNKRHSCYYNSHFSIYYNYKKAPIEIEVDATKKLLGLEPTLKKIIENNDTASYKKFIKSYAIPGNTSIKFLVAVRTNRKWYFFTSNSYGNVGDISMNKPDKKQHL